jgi:hypothetical protein
LIYPEYAKLAVWIYHAPPLISRQMIYQNTVYACAKHTTSMCEPGPASKIEGRDREDKNLEQLTFIRTRGVGPRVATVNLKVQRGRQSLPGGVPYTRSKLFG